MPETTDSKPLLVLVPKNNFLLDLANGIRLSLLFGVFGGVFLGLMFQSIAVAVFLVYLKNFGIPLWLVNWVPFAFFFLLFFLATPVALSFLRKQSAKNMEKGFRFYHDYFEMPLWSDKTIRENYGSISKVELKKGIIQNHYGLGTIVLTKGENTIWIMNLERPDEAFRKVNGLAGKAKH